MTTQGAGQPLAASESPPFSLTDNATGASNSAPMQILDHFAGSTNKSPQLFNRRA
jgi:hypothetical protein